MKTYLCVYLGSAFLALVITPVIIWLARHLKAADHPGTRTVHKKPVPRIGGAAIFVSMICLIVPVLFLHNTIGQSFRSIHLKVITLLSAAAFMFVVGVIDDIKGLRARIVHGYYQSREFRAHYCDKVRKFPHIERSFSFFHKALVNAGIVLNGNLGQTSVSSWKP